MSNTTQEFATVLVIENEPLVQRIMARLLLKKFGVTAQFATTGEEAVKVLELRSDWTLVISDWDLDTEMDGGEVLLWVLDQKPDLLNKYVFLSSSSQAEDMAHNTGIPFIQKPKGVEHICDIIRPFFQHQVIS